MKTYLKYGVWDFVICTVIAGGFIINFYNGYNMTDRLSGSLLAVFVITALIQFILALVNSSRRSRIAGICLGVVALVVIITYNQMVHPFLHEKAFSSGVFWILMVVLNVLIFFLTRKLIGVFFLFAAGNLVIASEVFLEFGLDLTGYILFLMGCAAMIFWRVYLQGLVSAITARMQVKQYMTQILMVCLCAMLVSALIFVLILGPLQLKTHELKLIEELQSMEVVHKIGTSTLLPELDESMTSSNDANYSASSQKDPLENEEKGVGDEESASGDKNKDDIKSSKSDDEKKRNTDESETTPALAIRYLFRNLKPLIFTLLVIGAIAAAIHIKRKMRMRFLAELSLMERRKGIICFYNYYRRTLSLVKIKKQGHLTPREFAKANRKYIRAFISGQNDFEKMTEVYNKVLYGDEKVSDEDWNLFHDAYIDYHDNIYEEVGKLRYMLLFFRI